MLSVSAFLPAQPLHHIGTYSFDFSDTTNRLTRPMLLGADDNAERYVVAASDVKQDVRVMHAIRQGLADLPAVTGSFKMSWTLDGCQQCGALMREMHACCNSQVLCQPLLGTISQAGTGHGAKQMK